MKKTFDTPGIPGNLRKRIERLAINSNQSYDQIVGRALEAFLETQAWRDKETRKALLEVELGDLASNEEVQAIFDKWLQHGGTVE